jgi:hypothetical protein
MKKIISIVISFVLIILIVISLKTGIRIGNFKILSIDELRTINKNLDNEIDKANDNTKEYQETLSKIKTNYKTLASAKKLYTDSQKEDEKKDIKDKSITSEKLWKKVEEYAKKRGVNLKMNMTPEDTKHQILTFTVIGPYLGISNFIYELENDSDLKFVIDDFAMNKNQTTFIVKNVNIINE